MLIMKSGKRQMTEGIEQPNQEMIRKLEEKETFKYLGILEVETLTHEELNNLNTSGEWENFFKLKHIAENFSKRWIHGLSTS